MALAIGEDLEPYVPKPAIGEDLEPIGDTAPLNTPPPDQQQQPPYRPEYISATPNDLPTALAALGRLTDNIMAPGSEHTTPLVSQAVAQEAVRRAALPARIVARLGGMGEFEKGMEKSAAENVQGAATAEALASLPAFGLPGMGEAFALNVASKLPEQYGRIKESIQKNGFYSAETGKAITDAGIQDAFGFLAFKAGPHLREQFATNIKKTVAEKGGDIIESQRTIPTDQGGFTSTAEQAAEQQSANIAQRLAALQQEAGGGTQPEPITPQQFVRTIPSDQGPIVAAEPTAAESGGTSAGEQPTPVRVDTGADQGPRSPDEIAAASGEGAQGEGGQGAQVQGEVATPTPDTGAVQPAPVAPPTPEQIPLPAPVDPIVSAANRAPDGRIFTGVEHFESSGRAQEAGVKNSEAGFVTQSGRFLNPEDAHDYAIANKQVSKSDLAAASPSGKDEGWLEANTFNNLTTSDPPPAPPVVSTALHNTLSTTFKNEIKKGAIISDARIARVAKAGGIDAGAIRQWIDQGYQPSPEATAAESAARMARAQAPDGGFASHPLVQFVRDSGLMSKSTARRVWGKARYEENKSLWDSAPELPDPRQTKIYSKGGGQTPDKVASDAVDAGLLPHGADASDLFQALQKVADASHRQAAIERSQSVAEKVATKQANSFARAVAKPVKGEAAINASDLQVGHELTIRGEKFKVTDIDPDTFAVTMEDGSKFGVQTVADNQVIYGKLKGGVKRATQPDQTTGPLPTEQRIAPEQRAEIPPQTGDTRPQAAQQPQAPEVARPLRIGEAPNSANLHPDPERAKIKQLADNDPGVIAANKRALDLNDKTRRLRDALVNGGSIKRRGYKIFILDNMRKALGYVDRATGGLNVFEDVPINRFEKFETVETGMPQSVPKIEEYSGLTTKPPLVAAHGPRFEGDTYQIINGHHRYEAALRKGSKTLRTDSNIVQEDGTPVHLAIAGQEGGIPDHETRLRETIADLQRESPPQVTTPLAPESLKLLSSDALRAMLPTADPMTRGRIAWELGNRAPSDLHPGVTPPTLRPNEKAGELFQGEDQPFNLAGEKLDESAQKAAEEKAQAEQDRKIHDEENQVPFGFGPGGASIHENLNVESQIKQLNATISDSLRTPRNLNPRVAFQKAYQAVGKQFVTAKQSLAGGLNNVRTAWQAMKTVLMRPPVVADFISALKDWSKADQDTSFHVRQFVQNLRKQIKDPLTREAITNYIQADGDMNLLAQRAAASNIKYRPGYEAAMKLTPDQQTFAANIRQYFDAMLADGVKAGLLDHGIENYVNQLWKRPNRITKALQADIQSGKLQTNFQFARKRIFDSFFEGEQKGFVPASKDISALIAVYDQAFNKALSARAFVAALRNAKTAGGEPLVKFSGMQTELLGQAAHDAENAGAYLVRSRAIPEPAVTKDGRSYVPVDHPALRGWKLVVQRHNAPGGFPDVYYQTDMLVHPDYAPKVRLPGSPLSLKSILEPSALRQGPLGLVTNPLLKGGAFLKQTKLSLSLFHLDQEGLHGLFHRIDPAHLDPINFDDPTQAMLIRNGLVVADYRAQELFSEGLAGGGLVTNIPLLGRGIPFLGKMQTAFNEFLFKDYIPKLKMNMALHAYERNLGRRAFKGLTPEQTAEITANQANAAFGELNYRLLGRSQTMQDALRLLLIAPDFLEARSRFVGQAMKRYGGEQRAALILGSAITYTGARLMNQMLDNDPHWDKPFSVIYNKREYRLRTVMGDMFEVMTDPVRFFNNRFGPWIKEGITVATQRDITTGLRLTRFEQLKHALAWLVPIPIGGTEQANVTQRFLGASGVTNKPARGAIDDAYESALDYKKEVAKQDPQIAAEVKRASQEVYAKSDYSKLNRALYENDRERAVGEMEKLIETKGSDNVEKYYDNLPDKPFTGSQDLEEAWLRGIAQDQGKVARYKQAIADRDGMSRLFFQLRPYARPKRDISLTPVR